MTGNDFRTEISLHLHPDDEIRVNVVHFPSDGGGLVPFDDEVLEEFWQLEIEMGDMSLHVTCDDQVTINRIGAALAELFANPTPVDVARGFTKGGGK